VRIRLKRANPSCERLQDRDHLVTEMPCSGYRSATRCCLLARVIIPVRCARLETSATETREGFG
jgi:hypothetical protein